MIFYCIACWKIERSPRSTSKHKINSYFIYNSNQAEIETFYSLRSLLPLQNISQNIISFLSMKLNNYIHIYFFFNFIEKIENFIDFKVLCFSFYTRAIYIKNCVFFLFGYNLRVLIIEWNIKTVLLEKTV